MKNFLNQIGAWTIKHHWIFLLLIFGLQVVTGEVIGEPREWGFLMNFSLARRLHILNGKLIIYLLIYMAGNKLWLYLKRSGKI